MKAFDLQHELQLEVDVSGPYGAEVLARAFKPTVFDQCAVSDEKGAAAKRRRAAIICVPSFGSAGRSMSINPPEASALRLAEGQGEGKTGRPAHVPPSPAQETRRIFWACGFLVRSVHWQLRYARAMRCRHLRAFMLA
jgi:hypothetical protein